MSDSTEILIIGSGLVGASLAIALDQAGRHATLVEAGLPRVSASPGPGDRNLVLGRATINALDVLGIWKYARVHATPISRLHVSRAGEFGAARVSASEVGVPMLGATMPARELGNALEERVHACKHLTRLMPAKLESVSLLRNIRQAAELTSCDDRTDAEDNGWHAVVRMDGHLRSMDARLLVGADGSDSFVRAQVGIGASEHDYAQSLIVCTVKSERDPDGCAYERFSDDGPVALLPLSGQRCGLVLTVPANQADTVLALSDAKFVALAQARFGWKLGRLTAPGRRQGHHARRVLAQSLVASRSVVIGNAAQTVHPIGAQGFNLGLRDALTLAEMIVGAEDPGASELLQRYAARRAPDREGVLAFSHGLVSLACLPQPVLAPLRSLALIAFDSVPPLKRALAKRGMGWRGTPPDAVLERSP